MQLQQTGSGYVPGLQTFVVCHVPLCSVTWSTHQGMITRSICGDFLPLLPEHAGVVLTGLQNLLIYSLKKGKRHKKRTGDIKTSSCSNFFCLCDMHEGNRPEGGLLPVRDHAAGHWQVVRLKQKCATLGKGQLEDTEHSHLPVGSGSFQAA